MNPQNLILCPLKKEWKLLEESCGRMGITTRRHQDGGRWSIEIPAWQATLCVGGLGSQEFTHQGQYWLNYFPSIQQLFVVGSAGRLSSDLAIGDLLWVKEVSVPVETEVPPPRFTVTSCPESLPPPRTSFDFQIVPGRILSLDENITDPKRAQALFTKSQALAVAWESLAGCNLAKKNNRKYQEVRGITDFANRETERQFSANLPLVMQNIAKALNAGFSK